MQYNTKDASLKLIIYIKCYTDKIETLKVYAIRYNRFLFENMVIFNFCRTKQTQLSLLVLDLRSSIAETCTYMIVILFFFQAFFYLFKLFLYKQKENTTLKLIKLLLKIFKENNKTKKVFLFHKYCGKLMKSSCIQIRLEIFIRYKQLSQTIVTS